MGVKKRHKAGGRGNDLPRCGHPGLPSGEGQGGVGLAELVVDALDVGGGGMDGGAAEGFEIAAGGEGQGGCFVVGDPAAALGRRSGLIGQTPGRGREVLGDADPPGLGADAGAEQCLRRHIWM